MEASERSMTASTPIANGEWMTNDQLDQCHGRTAMINCDGKMLVRYHYAINNEFPYSVGCLRETERDVDP